MGGRINQVSTSNESATPESDQPLDTRGENRSRRPSSSAFKQFMSQHWASAEPALPAKAEVADYAMARRKKLSDLFPSERLVIPAGPHKVRSNDTDYMFRPHSAFAHLTGLGVDHEPDAVLILEPVDAGQGDAGSNHQATLYFRPLAGRDTEQFYANARDGEFWIGKRPTLAQVRAELNISAADLSQAEDALTKNIGDPTFGGTMVRLVRDVDPHIDALVDTTRINTSLNPEEADLSSADAEDARLTEALSELRLIKDEYEIAQIREAVNITAAGFTEVVKALPRAVSHHRGERVIEGAFSAKAREEGNGVGYETIAAAGNNATILHWITNTGRVGADDLVLVDAGAEADSLYTADVTRTLPASGTFSPVQRRVYEAVLEAADAVFAIAKPGLKFKDLHNEAMRVLAGKLDEWGLLPVSVEVALSPEGEHQRRWMPHGTSHHLGLDVHDCAQAKRELYVEGVLTPGMVFTIEPGLYFKEDDLAVPEEYRGIGVRIEDDVLVTEDGNVNLSEALPRSADDVEAWMAGIFDAEARQQG